MNNILSLAADNMVAVAAAMEAPAILSALWLISAGGNSRMDSYLWREILLNGSIVLLVGAFAIGMITGEEGLAEISSFIVNPFKGVLCLFLLDMGLVAGRAGGMVQVICVVRPERVEGLLEGGGLDFGPPYWRSDG